MSVSDEASNISIAIECSSFLENSQFSGVGQYTYDLALGLKSAGYNTTFFTGPFYSSTDIHQRPSKFTTVLNKTYRKIASYLKPLPKTVKGADLVIFPNFIHLPVDRDCVSATVIHDLTYDFYPDMMEHKNLKYLKRVVPQAVQKSNFVITVSENTKKDIVKKFKIPPENCIVTPIPPNSMFLTKTKSSNIFEKYNIPKEFILYLGNIEPRKNIVKLLEAYSLLDKKIKAQYPLVLAGNIGWKAEDVKEKLGKLRRTGETILTTGFVDENDKAMIMEKAKLFVFPSLYEGYGMPPIEAMASKTATVVSDIPVLKSVCLDFVDYFDPKSAQSIASTITKSINNPSKERIELAYNHVKTLKWDNNISSILKNYEKHK